MSDAPTKTESAPRRIAEIAARLDAATPRPWKWGDEWATLDYQGREGGGDKYADLQLCGADDQEIIPLCVDHYEPIWDTARPSEQPSAADREFIAHAPEDIAYLLGLVRGAGSPVGDQTP